MQDKDILLLAGSAKSPLVCEFKLYNDVHLLDIRKYYTDKKTGELAAEGVAAAYWYNNNYHFIKNWDHLTNCKVAAPVGMQFLDKPQDYNKLDLPKSYDIIGRLVSINIQIKSTPEQLSKICDAFDKVLG